MTNFVNSKYTVTNLEVKANDDEIRGRKREEEGRVVRAEGIAVVMVFVLVVNVFVVAITTIIIITNSPFVTYGIVVVCHKVASTLVLSRRKLGDLMRGEKPHLSVW